MAAALGFAVLATDAQAAPTVSSGFDASATLQGAVRYRNFSNSGPRGAPEIRVGDGLTSPPPPDVHDVANPVSGDVLWGTTTPVTIPIKITYGSSTLRTEVGSGPVAVQKLLNPPPSSVNYLQITLRKNQTPTAVALNNVMLDGQPLGSFNIANGSSGILNWKVTGIILQTGFTLTGTLALNAPGNLSSFASSDSNFVQIALGSVVPPDTEAPSVSDPTVSPRPVLLNGQGTVTATVDDSGKGDNQISSAEYSLDGGPWTAMGAADGAFDEVSESVTATFTATAVGTHEVCVRGTDAVGNTSDGQACEEFLVDYQFAGFFAPIDKAPAVNVARAGQAVPAKWRLTDANGAAISDPTSFTGNNGGLYSFQVSCQNFSEQLNDAVEEYAPGSSGLQYNGDGYWQFNWKTPKTYANTCRAMYVQFDSGGASPAAFFSFK